jgi:ABC-type nitrate/sulfonate/bicarbonate transport system permease component
MSLDISSRCGCGNYLSKYRECTVMILTLGRLAMALMMLAVSLPVFAHSILDAVKNVPKELLEMTPAFRPTRAQVLRLLILPSIVPNILTAWKVSIGFAVRVVIVAELVGASTGVGYRMVQQQSLLNMSGVLAWTLVLVLMGLILQGLITRHEQLCLNGGLRRAESWRPSSAAISPRFFTPAPSALRRSLI